MLIPDDCFIRFVNKVNFKKNKYDCWEWTGAKSDGYGSFRYEGRSQYTHRLMAKWNLSNYSESLLVCHKCDNPSCVRPDHFFMGTASDNGKDSFNKGRRVDWHKRKTHCPQGHPYSGTNLLLVKGRINGSLWRVCKACQIDSTKRRNEKRKLNKDV